MATKKAFSAARWNDIKTEIRTILIGVARDRQLITYSDLTRMLQTASLHYHSPALARLLVEIGSEELQAGRPSLPALVVTRQTGIPGAGFFKIDGQWDADITDPVAYWSGEVQNVYDYWSQH
jgi:hypothetical protein